MYYNLRKNALSVILYYEHQCKGGEKMKITLRAARINKGLTQAEVGAALSVNKKTVGSWEKGRTMPNTKLIEPL